MAQWERAQHKQDHKPVKKKKQDEQGEEDKKVRPQKKRWNQKDLDNIDIDEGWDDGEFD